MSETTLRQPEPEPVNGYESLGGFAVERSPFVELRRFPNGRARVLVNARCAAWSGARRIGGARGVLVLEPDGAMGRSGVCSRRTEVGETLDGALLSPDWPDRSRRSRGAIVAPCAVARPSSS